MVTANVEQSAMGVTNAIESRDITGIAALGFLTVGGLFLAQELTDQVLPMLGMSGDPSTPSGLGAAILLKLVGAAVTVALATRGGASIMYVGGILAFGMLASAGLDAFDFLQRGSLPGSALMGSAASSGSTSSGATVSRAKPQKARRTSASSGRVARAGGGSRGGGTATPGSYR